MKWVVASALSAVFIALASMANAALSQMFERNLATFTLWFVVPFGGFIIGMAGGFGISLVEKVSNTNNGMATLGFGAIAGFASWVAVNLTLYHLDTGGQIGILSWLSDLANGNQVIGLEVGHAHGDFDIGSVPFLGWIAIIVQPFGAIVGGVASSAAA